jgi:hypothetical protein
MRSAVSAFNSSMVLLIFATYSSEWHDPVWDDGLLVLGFAVLSVSAGGVGEGIHRFLFKDELILEYRNAPKGDYF